MQHNQLYENKRIANEKFITLEDECQTNMHEDYNDERNVIIKNAVESLLNTEERFTKLEKE